MYKLSKKKLEILISLLEVLLMGFILFLVYKLLYIPIQNEKYFPVALTPMPAIEKSYEVNKSNTTLDTINTKPVDWYDKAKQTQRKEFYKTLINPNTILIVIFAGETRHELCKRLANDMKLDSEKLLKIYESKSQFVEGDIFAGRYILPRNADEKHTMNALFDASLQKLQVFTKKYEKEEPKLAKIKALITIASIIQKESNSEKEMPFISSVIYNRLEKNMRLQMDGTLNYGKYSRTVVTPERLKEDTSLYNTYKHKGLPPAPLGVVSLSALEAAYTPRANKYLFFMLKMNGMHKFANTYEEHLENVHIFKEKQRQKKALAELNASDTNHSKVPKLSKEKKTKRTKVYE